MPLNKDKVANQVEKEEDLTDDMKYAKLLDQKQKMRLMAERRRMKLIEDKESFLNYIEEIENKVNYN